jgi:hypothetical protein
MIEKSRYKRVVETVSERCEKVRERIRAACRRAGRQEAEIGLVAVSKTHGPEKVREVAACGISVFGENKVQEAASKIPECPGNLTWHLVGHLQRNKAAKAVELFDLIHSVDSLRLIEAIDRVAADMGKTARVLLEVNVSGEGTKFGLKPEEVAGVLSAANKLARVEIRGLMTMPPLTENPEDARPYFRRLRELRDSLRGATGHALAELSMGMSHDFEVAIEEGAHWIRVGTALFGERERPEATEATP